MNLEDGVSLLISGRRDGLRYQGVGLAVSRNAKKALNEWEPTDERLLHARLKSKHGNINKLVCYAPTNNAPDDMKDDFYGKLQDALGRIARLEILLCTGDFNAVLGRSNEEFEKCMGKLGAGSRMKENGIRFGVLFSK
ncbi:craniofacial development protein 2-like [Penaeus vannamei]|uniref:craniofacial development protein 2-like n=1 Tax=Penaeus vannamei TaxID=6689 RepID=UPI00387F95C0